MSLAELSAATKWARETCHAVYGAEEGERVFRAMPAVTVLMAWRSHPRILFPA